MSRHRDFVENGDGVHLLSPLNREYTLCGDAFDISDTEDEDDHGGVFVVTRKRAVTCENCAAVIRECRGVRTA